MCVFWRREGFLKPGQFFSHWWTVDGQPSGTMQVRVQPAAVVLSFTARVVDQNEWQPVEQRAPIVWTSCHLGGLRSWFCCMAVADGKRCGKRAAILYLGESLIFACRHCYRLSYATQLEPVGRRGIARARKIRMKLGGGPNLFDPFPAAS